jgi:hypothetical protein
MPSWEAWVETKWSNSKWREVQALLEKIVLIVSRECLVGANINDQSKSLW